MFEDQEEIFEENINDNNNEDNTRLRNELIEENQRVEELILRIEERQLEIITMIEFLKSKVQILDQQRTLLMQQRPPDFKYVNYLDKLIFDNSSLINSFYNSHKEYEAVKSKHIKNKNEHSLRMNHFLLIQLNKLDSTSDNFKEMFKALVKLSENKSIINNIDYDNNLLIDEESNKKFEYDL
jgi:hypothetical protein